MIFESRPLLPPEAEYTRRTRAVAEGEVPLEDLPEIMGVRLYHLRILAVGFTAWMIPSMTIGTVPFILDTIVSAYGVTQSEAVLVGSMILFGAIPGTILCGPITDRCGRRCCLVICCVCTLVLSCLHLLLPGGTWTGFACLLALRFTIGIFYSALCVITPLYVLEFTPDDYRGAVCGGLGFGWILGTVICILASMAAKDSWRLLLVLPVFPCVLCLFFCFLSPESLRWLFVMDREEQGYETLRAILSSKLVLGREYRLHNTPKVILPVIHAHSTKRGFWVQLGSLFGPDLRCVTIVCIVLWTAIAGYAYSSGYWVPHTLKKLSGAADFEYDLFLWSEVVNVLSCFAASGVLDLAGRKMGYIGAALPAALCTALFPLAIVKGGMVAVYACQLTATFFTGIVWSVLTAYCIEAFPTNLRGSGGSLAAVAGRLSAGALPIAVGAILDVSVYLGYCVIGGFLLIGVVAAFFIPQEMAKAKLTDEV